MYTRKAPDFISGAGRRYRAAIKLSFVLEFVQVAVGQRDAEAAKLPSRHSHRLAQRGASRPGIRRRGKTVHGYPDSALLLLHERYERALVRIDAVSPAFNSAESAYFKARLRSPQLDEEAWRKDAGLDAAERSYNGAIEARAFIIDKLAETPAQTPEGLIPKAEICTRETHRSRPVGLDRFRPPGDRS